MEHSTTISQPSPKFPTVYAQAEVDYRQALLNRQRTLQKYKDIDGATKEQKLSSLKDMSVNPFMLNDGYDALTNALQRWKTLATSREASTLSPQEKDQAAENYWKTTLEPIYSQKLKAKPVDLAIWKQEAYNRVLQWNMDDAYNSHWRSGLYEGFKDYENIFLAGLQSLGGVLKATAAKQHQPVDDIPILDSTINSLKRTISVDTFWHDINPNQTWSQGAKSFIVEQAMMLPLYRATGSFNEGLIGSLGGGAKVPLTQLLAKSNLASTVIKLLTNGAEGAAYGYTMQDPADRKNGWQWGIQQAILGTLFSSKLGKFKLKDVVNPEEASKIGERETEIAAGKNGFVKNDSEALESEASKALSGVSAAGGRPAVLSAIKSALIHLKDTENLSAEELRAGIEKNLSEDKSRWNSVYITSSYLRAILAEQGKKFSELKPEEVVELKKKLISLVQKSETSVPKLLAAGKGDTAAAMAAQEVSKKPIEEALDIAARKGSTEPIKIGDDPGTLRVRTRYGKDAVSYSVNKEWISYARNQVKTAGLKWNSEDIKKWLDDLNHEDFTSDLREFFYPKALKKIDPELKWEYKSEDSGKEYPNFLAFMYNYKDQMPKQFAQRLSRELEDTNKFEQWFNPRQDVEKQKDYYAKGMYAHIQELLASERYKKPNALGQIGNVYQTTYETLHDPTEYQYELHKETIEAEQNLLTKMFRGPSNRQALKQAMNAYNILAADRFKAFSKGQQETRIAKQSEIDKMLVESSRGDQELLEF